MSYPPYCKNSGNSFAAGKGSAVLHRFEKHSVQLTLIIFQHCTIFLFVFFCFHTSSDPPCLLDHLWHLLLLPLLHILQRPAAPSFAKVSSASVSCKVSSSSISSSGSVSCASCSFSSVVFTTTRLSMVYPVSPHPV